MYFIKIIQHWGSFYQNCINTYSFKCKSQLQQVTFLFIRDNKVWHFMWIVSLIRIYNVVILLFIFDWNPYLQQWMCPNSEMEESMSETWGWKDFFVFFFCFCFPDSVIISCISILRKWWVCHSHWWGFLSPYAKNISTVLFSWSCRKKKIQIHLL